MDQHHPQQDWSTCQLLVALHELCVLPLHHISCESLKRQIPFIKLYGVSPDLHDYDVYFLSICLL